MPGGGDAVREAWCEAGALGALGALGARALGGDALGGRALGGGAGRGGALGGGAESAGWFVTMYGKHCPMSAPTSSTSLCRAAKGVVN